MKWIVIILAVLICMGLLRRAAWAMRPDPAAARQQQADPASAGELAAILEPIRARNKLPALAGAIISGGQVRQIGAVGVRRAGDETPVHVDDLFHIGSCTKAMTATLIATLVEDGTLPAGWNTTIADVFGDLPMVDAWRSVTIEQLLHNRGGAPAHLNADGLWARLWEFKGSSREARMELVRGTLSRPPGPVGRYIYSNAGFSIAGAMAEQVTDTSWEDLMRARIFDPLGMTSAGFGAPGTADTLDQPRGHHANSKPEEPGPRADNPPAIGPASIVHCSLADWARFIALHQARAEPNLLGLSRETLDRLQTPAAGPGDSYAMGWLVATRPWAKGTDEGSTGRVLNHAGSNTLWYAVTWVAPERDFAVLIASNQGGSIATRACDEAAWALIQHHIARAQAPAETPNASAAP